jgi:hypothetical protein
MWRGKIRLLVISLFYQRSVNDFFFFAFYLNNYVPLLIQVMNFLAKPSTFTGGWTFTCRYRSAPLCLLCYCFAHFSFYTEPLFLVIGPGHCSYKLFILHQFSRIRLCGLFGFGFLSEKANSRCLVADLERCIRPSQGLYLHRWPQ